MASCNTQEKEVQHYIPRALDKNEQVGAIFLDFCKAFDTVPHKPLDIKLASLNINRKVLNWIQDYLSGRKQSVVLNASKLSPRGVTSTVPQRSVLGELLFLIYINGIVARVPPLRNLYDEECVIYRDINTPQGSSYFKATFIS